VTALLDINVLIALAWPNHVHHTAATAWFGARPSTDRWATTPLTEVGFVRVSSNRLVVATAVPPGDALTLLQAMCDWSDHEFWPDDVRLRDSGSGPTPATSRQVTDAHLLALVRGRGGRLVTFDGGVAELAGDRRQMLVELLRA